MYNNINDFEKLKNSEEYYIDEKNMFFLFTKEIMNQNMLIIFIYCLNIFLIIITFSRKF